jgi:uncharacterized protein YdcH (DUF465 family)
MIHAFDDREHAAASQANASLAPAGGPEAGKLVPGLVAATKNAPYRKVGAFPFPGSLVPPGVFPRGTFLQEDSMFEGQTQSEVEALMHNPEFKQLYQRHKQLDKQVLDAELGVLAVDDATLSQMKREKLAAKDRLTRLFDQRH